MNAPVPFEQLRAQKAEEQIAQAWQRGSDALYRLALKHCGTPHAEQVLEAWLAQARGEAFRKALHLLPVYDPDRPLILAKRRAAFRRGLHLLRADVAEDSTVEETAP